MKSGPLWLYGSSVFLIPFHSSIPVMTVINQLAPTHSFLDVFFFFSSLSLTAISDTGTVVPNGLVERCNAASGVRLFSAPCATSLRN